MAELRMLISVIREITGQHHKAQVCSVCGRNINAHRYNGRIFRVEVVNEYDQYSNRHACFKCVKKTYQRRIKDIPDEITRLEEEIVLLRDQRRDMMASINMMDDQIMNTMKPIICAPVDLKVREA